MKKILPLLLFILSSVDALSIPAYPAKSKIRKSDGSIVEVTLRGDEHFSFYSGNDGMFYVKREKKYLPISKEEIDSQWTSRMQAHEQQRQSTRQSSRRAIKKLPEVREYKGKKKGVVILIEFDDQKFSVSSPNALYKQFFNQIGYTENNMTGSVRDYFLEQSYGQLDIEFDIAGPFKAQKAMSYYGAPQGSNNDTCPWEIVIEGCKAADKDLNFKDYDWDDDGEVDQVFVIYAGYGQNYGASEYTIWPHEFNLRARGLDFKLDGTLINTYACSCELYGREGVDLDGIGAACHEFSHCLGLPDMYNTSAGSANAMLNWDVMCQGSYNEFGRTPAGFTAYERMYSGWLTPVELKEKTAIKAMKPLAKNQEAYIIYNDSHPDEFYMLENRQLVGFDAGLSGHGLLITHIDYDHDKWASNDVNVNTTHPRCAVVPADNISSLYGNSLSGDPFPGTSGVTAFSKYTQPAMMLFNEGPDGEYFLKKPIDSIVETEDGLISFIACRPELNIPAFTESKSAGDYSWTLRWDAVADATGYELELTEQPVAPHDPEKCKLLEEDFSGFYSSSNGLSDVSSKLVNYLKESKGWVGSKLFTSPDLLRIGTSSATGYIVAPTFDMPPSGEITVVIGVKPFTEGTDAEVGLRFITNSGYIVNNLTFTKEGKQVVCLSTRESRFRIGIYPTARIYLNYLAIYEGTYTEEELGIEGSANGSKSRISPRKVLEALKYTTTDTHYTFTGLTPTSNYFCRIRALGEVNNSLWSEEISFVAEGTLITGDVNCDGSVDISDIVAIINSIAGTASYSRADVNEDKNIDISDIVAVINIIANGE